MNKKLIAVIIGFLWLLIALGMILSKQYTLITGKTVVLETVPVDPSDFLRGDYVVLRYKLNSLDLNQLQSQKSNYRTGEKIYVKLEPKGKFWEPVAIYEKNNLPPGGLFIKGKVRYDSSYNHRLEADYGIESYFVPEGEGRELEGKMRGNVSSVSVEVVVDSSGNALIKKVYVDQ